MAKYGSPFVIPVVVGNPTDSKIALNFSVDLPDGWTFRRRLPASVSVGADETATLQLELKTASQETTGWHTVAIDAISNGSKLGQLRIRVQLDAGAMPE
jgi:uncharacterized membrane protein